jgi:3-oxoacyl-[acyl-carrier protein] reductase
MLSGRLACVTGGARGIGLAVSKVLAREGADVAVLDLSAADATDAANVRYIAVSGSKQSANCDQSYAKYNQ